MWSYKDLYVKQLGTSLLIDIWSIQLFALAYAYGMLIRVLLLFAITHHVLKCFFLSQMKYCI